jgi:hypothetical protein
MTMERGYVVDANQLEFGCGSLPGLSYGETSSRKANAGVALFLDWFEAPTGSGSPTEEGSDWIIHLAGSSTWKNVNFPTQDIEGLESSA